MIRALPATSQWLVRGDHQDRAAPAGRRRLRWQCVDHRILGTWSTRGAQEFLDHWRAQLDVTDANTRDHEILALEPDAFLVRRPWFGRDREGGGAFENVNLALFAFGADGLLTRVEVFDPDDEAEALARFEELTSSPIEGRTEAPRFANAATRAIKAFERC